MRNVKIALYYVLSVTNISQFFVPSQFPPSQRCSQLLFTVLLFLVCSVVEQRVQLLCTVETGSTVQGRVLISQNL